MRGIRVVISGPSRIGRDALARRLAQISRDVRVVEQASSPEKAAALTRRHHPDVVVLLDGTASDVDAIRAACPRPPQVVLVPSEPPPNAPTNALVLPRSLYETRALELALGRAFARI